MISDFNIPFTSHAPKANLYSGNPTGQYVNSKNGDRVSWFLQQKTAGTNTGTATVTVLAATNNAGGSAAAVPFVYRKKNTGVTVTTFGAATAAAAAGFTTTANENTVYEIEVDSHALPEDKPYIALKLTEVVADAVDGGVLGLISNPRFVGGGIGEASA